MHWESGVVNFPFLFLISASEHTGAFSGFASPIGGSWLHRIALHSIYGVGKDTRKDTAWLMAQRDRRTNGLGIYRRFLDCF